MSAGRRIIVVGGLAAGPAAASQARRSRPDCHVVVLEADEVMSVGVCELPFAVGGVGPSLDRLTRHTPATFMAEKGIEVRLSSRVLAIDRRRRELTVQSAERGTYGMPYDRLILATGATPRRLPVALDHPAAPNLITFKTLADARALDAWLGANRAERAVVIGGGYIGLELADALRHRGVASVTVVDRTAQPMARVVEPEIGAVLVEAMGAAGVRWMGEQTITALETDASGRVCVVQTATERLATDLVIVAIGVAPNVSLGEAAGLRLGETGAYRVNNRQQTSDELIYAVGDCAETTQIATGRSAYLPLANLAYRQAQVAGTNAVGGRTGPTRFPGALGTTAVQLFGVEIAATGVTLGEATRVGLHAERTLSVGWNHVPSLPGAGRLTTALVFERRSGRLLGGSLIGPPGTALRADMLALAVGQKLTLAELAEQDFLYHPPVSPLRDPLTVAAWRGLRSRT